MKSIVKLCTTDTSKFEVMKWEGTDLYLLHTKIQSYLKRQLSNDISFVFAEPRVISRHQQYVKIQWLSRDAVTPLVKLSDLKGEVSYQEYQTKLSHIFAAVHQLVRNIKDKGADASWAYILEKAIVYGGDDYVFIGNDNKLIIAAWSMLPSDVNANKFGVMGRDIPQKPPIRPPQQNPTSTTPPTLAEPEIPDEEFLGNKEQKSEQESAFSSKKEEPPISSNDQESVRLSNENTNGVEDEIKKETESNDGTERSKAVEESSDLKNESGGGKETPPKPKRWWIWLLILLGLLALLFIYRSCDFESPDLPSDPGVIVPIDSTDIGYGQDSIVKIVVNRINIHVEGNGVDFERFAADFKQAYPSNDFKVIYYDTLTSRVQLQVPASEMERVKSELPNKLPQYTMLIWDESLFEGGYIPKDPGFSDRKKKWYFDVVQAYKAWDYTKGDQKVIVAVVDNGFDITHPELENHVYKPYNVVTRTSDVFTYSAAKHGSHVAGTALGEMGNNEGVAGIAPNCLLMPIQVSDANGKMSFTAVVDGVLYAINQGATVVNLSLGKEFNNMLRLFPKQVQYDMIHNSFKNEEAFWNKIFKMAEKKHVTLIMAAGNQDLMVGLDPMQRNPLGVKVNAVGPSLKKASFSNYGKMSTVSAPGVEIYSSTPNNSYEFFQGTSMASPIVTGAVALVKSVNPNMATSDIIDLLKSTGKPLSVVDDKTIGNLLQIENLLKALKQGQRNSSPVPKKPNPDCQDVQKKIDRLLAEIEQLKKQCPNAKTKPDTLKLPEKIVNTDFITGRWKSTTSIINEENEQVTLFFDFYKGGSGKLTLVEPNGTECEAALSVSIVGSNRLEIDQETAATCDPNGGYSPYFFECEADKNGYAACKGQNKNYKVNTLTFKLIKIR